MSRCFPYGPTLCARNGASGEALIETIKLHCNKDKSKTESLKEKKRDRKVKKKDRKEKEVKPYGFNNEKVKNLHHEKCFLEEKNRALLGEHLSKKTEDDEAERLEKSSLTEEHDEPVCYLSDGTQSSNKRKRQPAPCSLPCTTPSITVHKNILRIRLPSLKRLESDPSLSKGRSCPTVGRVADPFVQQVSDKVQCQITKKVEEANLTSDSSRKDCIPQFDASSGNRTTLDDKNVPGTESFYKVLIEDWVPPPFQSVLNDGDDEDWLFGRKRQSQNLKRLKAGDVLPSRQSSTLWPCAHHLPEADIYALPYSIPF